MKEIEERNKRLEEKNKLIDYYFNKLCQQYEKYQNHTK